MKELFNNLTHGVQDDYNLQNKHLFKKKTGNAQNYYQLVFDQGLESDLKILHRLYISNMPFRIFGSHTNLYITENGYSGLFVDISHKNAKVTFNEEQKTFIATSNATVADFLNFTMKKGYDFSALAGIPGMIGSGVVGNSGWTPSGKDFGDFLKEITVYDFEKGELVRIKTDCNFFKERESFIKLQNKNKTRYFIQEVVLKSHFVGKDAVKEKFNVQMEKRNTSLKFGFKEGAAGSLWSNAHLRKLIGKSFPNMLRENPSINADFNGAKYSSCGSMFFITESNTTDKDVAKLFTHTLTKVKEIYRVDLHKEVIILDSDGEIDLETFLKRNV